MHVIGPERGLTQPGMTIVCGDSHTSTHGAFGALAFGIGTSEVEHVLASQCLLQRKPKTLEVRIDGQLSDGVSAKDVILALIAKIGIGGGTGHVIEYTGSGIRGLDMEARMTICNMSIEAGARAGMVAPDERTFEYLSGREHAPEGADWDRALERWRKLPSDDGARFDQSVTLDASALEPMITYGTNPGMGVPITAPVPSPSEIPAGAERQAFEKALAYMQVEPGRPLLGRKIDVVFVGSCTNGRLSDLRQAASVLKGRNVAAGVRALIVPGSQEVKRQAEAEGLDQRVQGRRRRVARSWLLDVHRHERRPARARAVFREHQQPQLRRPPGPGRTHLPGLAAHGGRRGGHRTRHRRPHAGRSRTMNRFSRVRSRVVVLPINNIDTDQIIPARFLKVVDKQGLGEQLFAYWRYDAEGRPRPEFALNRPEVEGAKVLLAGDNFGCGSSREHAPWALLGWGIHAVIATSFADIFKENSLKNGLLPVEVDSSTHARLLAALEADPTAEVGVDLESSELSLPDGTTVSFSVDGFARHCLLQGLDQLGYILSFEDRVEAYEKAREN